MDRFDNLQRPYQTPGMFPNWRAFGGFMVKVTTIGVLLGTASALIANGCSLHKPLHELASQPPGVIMEFKPVYVEPMPNVQAAIDLDADETLDI